MPALVIALLLQHAAVCAQDTGDSHLYAILLNGGRNRLTNHERYWNDCAFLYRTLRQTYHVPKRHIFVIMSDGDNPYADMLRADGKAFMSTPADLDGDGQYDIGYPATRLALSTVLTDLSKQLTTADHLFIFVMDHGGTTDHNEDSFLWLWNNEQLPDYVLGALLSRFDIGSMNILMGQCYAGGFKGELMHEGRILTTACDGDELSWICPDRPYDEFVYHWTCAVNGADESGSPVDADTNDDGEVSMAEAFAYASSHDRVDETPQYASWPDALGEQWTFARANSGTMGIREIHQDEQAAESIWTLSGTHRHDAPGHAVYILRQGGKTKKRVFT